MDKLAEKRRLCLYEDEFLVRIQGVLPYYFCPMSLCVVLECTIQTGQWFEMRFSSPIYGLVAIQSSPNIHSMQIVNEIEKTIMNLNQIQALRLRQI